MGRPGFTLAFLLFAAGLAGCATTTTETPSQNGDVGHAPVAVHAASRHELASNSVQAVPAGTTFHHGFEAFGPIDVGYSYARDDDGSVDIGFVRQADLAEFEAGQQVTSWAYQSNTAGTTQEVSLPAGTYELVIHCNNSFLDCDGRYSLWGIY